MLAENVREQFFIYMLRMSSVAAGGALDVPLDIQSDSAFAVRSVKSRNLPGMNGFRFRNSLGTYYANEFLSAKVYPTSPTGVAYPQRGGLRLSSEIVYPPQGVIRCDIENQTGSPLSNVELIFRGAKYFEQSRMRDAYPPRMAAMPGIQGFIVRDLPLVGSRQWIQYTNNTDADFVVRSGLCDPFVPAVEGGPVRGTIPALQSINPAFGQYTNVYAQLFDNELKPYSNVPIPINELFGQGDPFPSVENGGQDDPAFMRAGIFAPEIYVPRLHSLYLSVWRDDNTPGMGPVDLYVRLNGSKVIPQ